MPTPHPPRLAYWLLRVGLGPEHEALIGDLEEEYHDHAIHYGRLRAALIYWQQVLTTVPVLSLYSLIWHHAMFKNYLTTTLRNLRKHKGFSLINVFGLAVSMSVCLLVLLFIRDQRSYDRFHPHADEIYRVTSRVQEPYATFRMATSPGPLGPLLRDEYAGVEDVVRLTKFGGRAAQGNVTLPFYGLYAETGFFNLFGFELLHGDPQTALAEPYSVVLTEEAALKFFGDADPMGQVLTRENIGDFTVTGVVRVAPHKTNFEFEGLLSFATLAVLEAQGTELQLDDWAISWRYYTYLRLPERADKDAVATALPGIVARHYPADADNPNPPDLSLQALTNISLGSTGYSNEIGDPASIVETSVLSFLALLVMVVAGFNYVSLSTARSVTRAKEIGVRKVVGAHRTQILRQFLGEAVVIALLALVAASALLFWLVPAFNNLELMNEIGAQITFDPVADWSVYVWFVGFAVLMGVLAGLYPALRLSAFMPVRVLRGTTGGRGLGILGLRKALIVGQFTISMVLIVFALVVYQQFRFILQADYGLDQEHLIAVELQGVSPDVMKDELARHPSVGQVVLGSQVPIVGGNSMKTVQTTAMESPITMRHYAIDEHYLGAFNIETVAGRSFSPDEPMPAPDALVLTSKAVEALGYDSPQAALNQSVQFDKASFTIVGVVSDVYADGYEEGYLPLIFWHNPDYFRTAIVTVRAGQTDAALEHINTTWTTLAGSLPVQYTFFDEELEAKYAFVQDVIGILGMVTGIAVLVACLGLLGMASYTASSRVREVGIRKVMGAEVRALVVLLSRDYVVLLLIAVGLAVPLGWLGAGFFLEQFANRITLGPGIFLIAIGTLLTLALLTIGSQTLRAALTNPVDTLRHE